MNGEEYFCTQDGTKLNKGFRCPTCEAGHLESLKYDREYGINYVEKTFNERGTKWVEAWKNDASRYYYYVCHTCKNFMHHRMTWCYKCGQKREDMGGLTAKEFAERFPDYKQGC